MIGNIVTDDFKLVPIVGLVELVDALNVRDMSCFPVLCNTSTCSSLLEVFSRRHFFGFLESIALRVPVADASNDVVVATPGGLEELVAKRYALVTGRRYLPIDVRELSSHPEFTNFDSITLFTAPDLTELPRWLSPCRRERPGKGVLKLGVLAAQSLGQLTQIVARQLLMLSGSEQVLTTSNERSDVLFLGANYFGKGSQIERVGEAQPTSSSQELATLLQSCHGTVFVNAHSRPHCGILPGADGAIGLCGVESSGSGGFCVHGTACLFSNSPIVNMRELQCNNLFFNGCTTAAVASYRNDFLPTAALIAQAVGDSGVVNFVGNDRAGHFGDLDQLWFIAASSLGFSAAEAVVITDQYRVRAGRESEGAAVLFGDALSPPWPVAAVTTGKASDDGENALSLKWETDNRLLVAELAGRKWARLAVGHQVAIQTGVVGLEYAGILEHPWRDRSLFLAITDSRDVAAPLTIRLIARNTVNEVENVGEALAITTQGLHHSLLLPRFVDALPVDCNAIARHAVRLGRVRTDLHNIVNSSSLVDLLEEEKSLVAQIDKALLQRCLELAHERWSWHEDFASLESEGPARIDVSCPACGAVASVTQSRSLVDPRFVRETIACGFCGIVSYWPWSDLRVKLTICKAESALLEGTIAIANRGTKMRQVQVGMALRGCSSDEQESSRRYTCLLSPGSVQVMRYSLSAAVQKTGLMQLLLFAVSQGQIGVRSRMIFVGRSREPGKRGKSHVS